MCEAAVVESVTVGVLSGANDMYSIELRYRSCGYRNTDTHAYLKASSNCLSIGSIIDTSAFSILASITHSAPLRHVCCIIYWTNFFLFC